MATHEKISRRTWLKGMAVFSAAAGVPLSVVFHGRRSQSQQGGCALPRILSINGMQMCHMCKFYIGGRGGMMGGGMMGGGMM